MASYLTRRALSRRAFLAGAGAALGLPWLDAMTPALAGPARKATRRAVFVFAPNGQKLITKRHDPMMADYLHRNQQGAERPECPAKKPEPNEPAVQLWDVSGSRPEPLGALEVQPRATIVREGSTEEKADGRSIEHVWQAVQFRSLQHLHPCAALHHQPARHGP